MISHRCRWWCIWNSWAGRIGRAVSSPVLKIHEHIKRDWDTSSLPIYCFNTSMKWFYTEPCEKKAMLVAHCLIDIFVQTVMDKLPLTCTSFTKKIPGIRAECKNAENSRNFTFCFAIYKYSPQFIVQKSNTWLITGN